jgi:hypothetical protein
MGSFPEEVLGKSGMWSIEVDSHRQPGKAKDAILIKVIAKCKIEEWCLTFTRLLAYLKKIRVVKHPNSQQTGLHERNMWMQQSANPNHAQPNREGGSHLEQ